LPRPNILAHFSPPLTGRKKTQLPWVKSKVKKHKILKTLVFPSLKSIAKDRKTADHNDLAVLMTKPPI
jgi:hypothetical protein